MANEKIVVGAELKLETAQSLESVGKVKQAFKEAQKALHAAQEEFGEFSQEAIRAAKYVAQLKDRIGDAQSLVSAFNPDKKFQAFAQSVNGVAGGFSALQGVMGLVGVEGGEVEKMMLKVQSAMALSQGIDAVTDSIQGFKNLGTVIKNSNVFIKANEMATKAAAFTTKLFGGAVDTTATSFKFLKGAIAATGIGVLIVAIGELVSWFNELSSAAEKAAEEEKKALEQKAEYAKIGVKGEMDFINRKEQTDIAKAKLAGKSEKEIFDIQQQAQKTRIESQKRFIDEIGEQDENYIGAKTELKNMENKLEVDGINFQAQTRDKALEKQKQANDKEAQLAKQKAEQKRQQHDADVKAAVQMNEELAKANGVSLREGDVNKEVLKLEQEYAEKQKVIKKGGQDELELKLWFEIQKAAIEKKFEDERSAKLVEDLDKRLEAEKQAEKNVWRSIYRPRIR
jgi:hypothetical protein